MGPTAVFARGTAAGIEESGYEFEDSNSVNETRIACGLSMARFILAELRRIAAGLRFDLGFRTTLNEAAALVEQAIAHDNAVARE
jgi:hypothetical protein